MKRPWHIWLVFGLWLTILLAAMAWVSATALRLDRAEAQAREKAQLEETVRLALWRMDSALAPLIAQENARPYFAYLPFYPAERAYTRMFAEIDRGEVLVPSPLLTWSSPYIVLHFQVGPDGRLTSPQVPTGNMRDLAESKYVPQETIIAAQRRLGELQSVITADALANLLHRSGLPRPPGKPPKKPRPERDEVAFQKKRNAEEWQARIQAVDSVGDLGRAEQQATSGTLHVAESAEGTMRPGWVGGALVLARRVVLDGREYAQGCWLDWPAIRGALLAEAQDLLPAAQLEPLPQVPQGEPTRVLAALPVRLLPGSVRTETAAYRSPVRLSLAVAWVCVILAAGAVAALFWGAVSLSERRGAFVSAVTHEMRTPLTTFRMYTEMLADGMVPDGEKRRQYLDVLRGEADRLGLLVENVLGYARLERGRRTSRVETVPVGDLLARIRDRLDQRAAQAGMTLRMEPDGRQAHLRLHADPTAVEQILFNLVDNACKYAASASDKTIHVEPMDDGSRIALRVRDHGPGISRADARRLFRPFSKPGGNSAPGIGLGLALSRRLARSMGGDLRLDHAAAADGAAFVLTLPKPAESG